MQLSVLTLSYDLLESYTVGTEDCKIFVFMPAKSSSMMDLLCQCDMMLIWSGTEIQHCDSHEIKWKKSRIKDTWGRTKYFKDVWNVLNCSSVSSHDLGIDCLPLCTHFFCRGIQRYERKSRWAILSLKNASGVQMLAEVSANMHATFHVCTKGLCPIDKKQMYGKQRLKNASSAFSSKMEWI